MVGLGGNHLWPYCRDPNSAAQNSAGTRRRRVRLCRPTLVARHPPIQTRLQHEVPRNLCRLCRDHVDLRTNSHRNSFGFALGERCHNRADLFPWATTGKYDSGHRGGGKLCDSFCESLRARLRRSRDTFCNAASARWDAAPARRIGSAGVRATVRERIALWPWPPDEAACDFFHFIWNDFSLVQGRSEEHTSEPSHRTISYAVFCLKKKKKSTHL